MQASMLNICSLIPAQKTFSFHRAVCVCGCVFVYMFDGGGGGSHEIIS